MQTLFTFDELPESTQVRTINLYYADARYQDFCDRKKKELPDEVMLIEDWAREMNLLFNADGVLVNLEEKEKPFSCPLCSERTSPRQHNDTYIWVCPSCPFIGMEYLNDTSLEDLDYLLNRVN